MKSLNPLHLQFIMNLKKKGKSSPQIAEAFGKKYGIAKTPEAIRKIISNHKDNYDLESIKSVAEVKGEVLRDRILREFVSLVEKRKYVPTSSQFYQHSTDNRDAVSRQFGSFEGLIETARRGNEDLFDNIIDESAFTQESFKDLTTYINGHSRFIITTAVTGCEPHSAIMKAIDTFCEHNDAALLILPCSDPATTRDRKSKWSLSHKLPKDKIVFRDLSLNKNLILSTIKTSAKQIIPTTGLRRLSQKLGSVIMASPKQFLEYAAKSNVKDIPRALMTTGTVTLPKYLETKMYMSERTAYLADNDHTFGAIIVEVKDNKIFFFRQVQFEARTGAFCDLNKKYHADGTVEDITAELVQLPDYHVGSTDPRAKAVWKEVIDMTTPDIMTLEDFFDGFSMNPHERKNKVSQSQKALKNENSLDLELKMNAKEINELCKWKAKKLIFKYGNHEDFISRWINDGEYMNEPINKLLGLKLNLAMEEQKKMPFEYAMRELYGLDQPEKVRFLELEDSLVLSGIENGAHGHLGSSGRRNPGMAELEECYGPGNFGHNHSASIYRQVYRVGTSTYYQVGYNKGPSKWTQTLLIQHRNGTRQLINCIYGEWRLKD